MLVDCFLVRSGKSCSIRFQYLITCFAFVYLLHIIHTNSVLAAEVTKVNNLSYINLDNTVKYSFKNNKQLVADITFS